MRVWIGVMTVALVGCDVDRDLGSANFFCEGADCSAADAGVEQRDAGAVTKDAGTDATCDPTWGVTDACGGDIVGDWAFDSVCGKGFFESGLQESCPGVLVQRADAAVAGRIAFSANNTYAISAALDLDADFTVPSLCAPTGCPQLATILTAYYGGATNCTPSQTGCDCTYRGAFPAAIDGNYQLNGDIVTLETDPPDTEDAPYCVAGETLTYSLRGTTFVAHRR